ncbi:MAG: glucosamine-6-phosphate deaminase [Methanomassiliicoccales archaeon]|nr:glucosamine-6-phosphate deaminase [Methanomassiliicoccales archaeon]
MNYNIVPPVKNLRIDCLTVMIYNTPKELGYAAATMAAYHIRNFLSSQPEVNIMFAAAPSQNDFLDCLVMLPEIDWTRCNAFHLDEYLDLPTSAPQKLCAYLEKRVFTKVKIKQMYYIDDGILNTPEEMCARYEKLLNTHPTDIAFLGVGENGHIAFNDPHVANFNDPHKVKVVTIDEVSRNQQVRDGCFKHLEEVPKRAITVTIPAIMAAKAIICVVPGLRKQEAVKRMLLGPVTPECPASILRRHPNATLFLDIDAAKLIIDEMKV